MALKKRKLPASLAEAADIIIDEMSPEDQKEMKKLKRRDLLICHFGLGGYIRNEFGLWDGNQKLLESCDCFHPDDCSEIIIEHVWKKLRKLDK